MPEKERGPGEVAPAAALARTLGVIGGKWSAPIIQALLGGPRRFGELRAAIGPISPKILVARLKALEGEGFVTRTIYPEIPPRVEYALTAAGRTLAPIVAAMEAWGATRE